MSKTVQWKRGNTAVNSTYTGAQGEITVDTTDWSLYVHDGLTPGGYKISNDTDINVNIGNLVITNQTISGVNSNQDIIIDPLGTGNTSILGNLVVSANITGQYFVGNGALLTGITDSIGATGPVGATGFTGATGATGLGTNYSNANVVAYSESGWAGNIIPSANAVYSLGAPDKLWANIWVANNTIYFGNTAVGINSNNILTVNNQPVLSNDSNTPMNLSANFTAGNISAYTIVADYQIESGQIISGNIMPSANATYSLGGPNLQWANLWVANNTIYFGNIAVGLDGNNVLTVNSEQVLTNNAETPINLAANFTAGNLDAYRIVAGYQISTGELISGDIMPSANATYSLGGPNLQWANLWVANNTIYFGNIPVGLNANNILTVNEEQVLVNNSESPISLAANFTAGNLDAYQIVADFKVTAQNYVVINAIEAAIGSSPAPYISGFSYISTTGNGNITADGNLIANANVHGDYFHGNGSLLTGLSQGANLGYLTFDKDTIQGTDDYTYTFATDGYFSGSTNSESPNYFFIVSNVANQNVAVGWTVVGPNCDTTVDGTLYPVPGYPGVIQVNLATPASSAIGFYPVVVTSPDRLQVEIQPDPTNNAKYTFTTANLTLPSGGTISEGISPTGLGNVITLTPSGGGDSDQQLKIYPTGGEGNHLHLTTGNLYQTELFLGSDNLYVKISSTGNVVVNPNDGIGNTAQWTFDKIGILVVPGEGVIRSIDDTVTLQSFNTGTGFANSVYVGTSGGLGFADASIGSNWLEIFRSGSDPQIATPGNLTIVTDSTSTAQTWTFDDQGNLTLPTGGKLRVSGEILAYPSASPAPSISGFSTADFAGNVTASYFIGNGSQLTGISAGSNYTNSNVVTLLSSFGSNTISTTGNITGNFFIGNGRNLTGLAVGSNTRVQFNTNGNLDSADTFLFDKNGNVLQIGTSTNSGTLKVADIQSITGILRLIPASGTSYSYGHFNPLFTNTYDLGQSGSRWQNFFANAANVTSLVSSGNVTASNLIASGNTFISGYARLSGTFDESQASTLGLYLGYAGGTPRMMFATGNTSQTLEIDNDSGTLRFYKPGTTLASLTNTGDFNLTGNITVGTSGSGTANINGRTTTGINSILAGVSNTILPNTVASFSTNVNNYTQVTFQNKNTGGDATADFILTADNGSDSVNYGDFGIINSGYDNATPTNSLGNIVYAADTYLYAQGNTSAASQSGGNLVIGTTTAGKSVKIFAGGANSSALIATVSNTGIVVNGNVTAGNLSGNISITGNITGTSSNVTLVAGSYSTIFDNTGTATFPGNISGNTNGFAIGYRDIPQVTFSANATAALTDAGKHYYSTTAGNLALTLPNNSSVTFSTGSALTIVVNAAGNVLVNQGSGVTLYQAGSSTTGNRVVGAYGMATVLKVAANTWVISGTGVY